MRNNVIAGLPQLLDHLEMWINKNLFTPPNDIYVGGGSGFAAAAADDDNHNDNNNEQMALDQQRQELANRIEKVVHLIIVATALHTINCEIII
jgi:hypothetical protein